jgi:hypothetical protein
MQQVDECYYRDAEE